MAAKNVHTASKTKKKKILLVVDVKETAKFLRSILTKSGYKIITKAATAVQAIQSVKKLQPDLIIIDKSLSGELDGIETAILITDAVDIPIIFLADKTDKKTLKRAKIVDLHGCILKPFDERDVQVAVEMALYKFAMEKKLRESRLWFSTTLRSIGDAVIATDKHGKIIFMNSIAENLTEWEEHEAIGKKLSTVFNIVHEKNGKRITNPVNRVLSENKIIELSNQAVLISKHGKKTCIEDSAAPIYNTDGTINGVVLTFRNVTEKKKTQQVLLDNEKRFRALVERSSEAFSILDIEGNIRYTTNSAVTIHGYTVDEIVGRNVFEFLHPDEIEKLKKAFQDLLAYSGRSETSLFRFRHKDDHWRWIEAVGTNLLNDSAINGIVVNFRDVTYRYEAEARLQYTNDRLNLLSKVTGEVIGTSSIQNQIQKMAELVRQAFTVDAVIVRTVEDDESRLVATAGISEDQVSEKLPSKYGLTGLILSRHKALTVKNLKESFNEIYPSLEGIEDKTRNAFVSCLCSPIIIGHAVIGTIGLYTTQQVREFSDMDLEHLQIVANHIAVAMANNSLFKAIKSQNDLLQTEIRERKKIEEHLRGSEERWRTLVNNAPNIIAQIDNEGKILFINNPVPPLTIKETIGKSVLEFVTPEYFEKSKNVIDTVFQTGKPMLYEVTGFGAEGKIAWYSNRISPIFEDGKVVSAIVISSDISEMKMNEIRLREAMLFNHEIITNVGEGIIVYDTHFRIKLWNKYMERVTGIPEESLRGKNVFDIFPHLKEEGVHELLEKALRGKIVTSNDVMFRVSGNAAERWMVGTYSPHRNDAGEIIGVIVTYKDITDRKISEDALRESELRFRALFENAKDAVFIADPATGVIINANLEAERLLLRKRSEIIGMHQTALHPPERSEEASALFSESMLTLGEQPIEFEVLRSDGVRVPVEIKASLIRFGEERIVLQGIFRDITERKNADRILREKEERYRAFVEQSSEGIYRTAFDEPIPTSLPVEEQIQLMFERSYIAECNDVMAKMYGYNTAQQAVGIRIKDLLPSTDPYNIEYMKEFIEKGYKFFDAESHEFDLQGNQKYFLNNAIGIIENGLWKGVWGTQRDITERKLAEEQLRISEEKYRTLFEESKDGLFISMRDGKLLDANSAMVQILGYDSKEDLLSADLSVEVFISKDEQQKFLNAFVSKDYVKDYERILRKKDGTIVYVLVTAVAERDATGAIIKFRGSMRDITERKKLEQQLLQAQKMESIGTLAGGIAHDFNNLLAMILGTAELLQKQIEENPKHQLYLKKIIEASERGASISKQLLLFARPEQAEMRPLMVKSFIEQFCDFLTHFLPKTVSVVSQIENGTQIILGDYGQLHQALLNLALNAKDAMNENGTITITVHQVTEEIVRVSNPDAPQCEYAAITLSDTGSGMSEEVRRRMFEPFFSTKERSKGTGLGLSIVHGIVKLHQGYIDVVSEIGVGTSFTLYFPLLSIDVAEVEETKTQHRKKNTETILIVEDEEILREILRETFIDEGYSVVMATNGLEALELYSAEKIHLVITDLGMPIMGGEELFQNLKSKNPDVKVIVTSGYLDSATRSELLRLGIKEVITKPYKFEVIFETVRNILDS